MRAGSTEEKRPESAAGEIPEYPMIAAAVISHITDKRSGRDNIDISFTRYVGKQNSGGMEQVCGDCAGYHQDDQRQQYL